MGESAEKHRALTWVVALIPFSVVPLEVPGVGGFRLGPLLAVALLVLAISTGAIKSKATGLGVILGVLAVWVTVRLTLLSLSPGEVVDLGVLVREVGGLGAAFAAFILARQDALRPAIYKGLCVALALTLGHEAYQLTSGLSTLMSNGYTSEAGYYYYTFDGSYRPFGGFAGPTTFGTFLAMLGVFVVVTMRPGWLRVGVFLAVVAGVLLTDTRAAWIGCVLAALVVGASSPTLRRRAGVALVFGVPALIALVLIFPAQAGGVWERATSATEQSDTSRVTRTALWEGVVSASQNQGRLLDGFGAQDWATVMQREVGSLAGLGHAHSNFFQEWFRYGLIGFVLFAALVVAMIAMAVRGARSGGRYGVGALAAVVVYVADSVFNNSLSSINFTVAAFLILGLGYVQRPLRTQPARSSRYLATQPVLPVLPDSLT